MSSANKPVAQQCILCDWLWPANRLFSVCFQNRGLPSVQGHEICLQKRSFENKINALLTLEGDAIGS